MKYIATIWVCLLAVAFAHSARAQDSTMIMKYQGQPVTTAVAPSMSAFSQDVCGIPLSGAVSTVAIGVSGGTIYTDVTCEKIKLAKTLADMQLKVAAVAVLCQDERVWQGMMSSGSPCPIDGLVGDAARNQWIKLHPKKFERLYGFVPPLPTDIKSEPVVNVDSSSK